MTETIAPPGETVAASTLHAGDQIVVAELAVTIRRVIHGSAGDGYITAGHNFALCDWQGADPSERGTACFCDGDTVRRLSEGRAAA